MALMEENNRRGNFGGRAGRRRAVDK